MIAIMDEWLRARIARAELIAERVRELELQPVDGRLVRPWGAGAHVRVRARTSAGQLAERRYSLVGAADRTDAFVIAVRRAHDQGVSAYLHDDVQVGTLIEVSQPSNDFALDPGPHHSVLIAGGIGITPLLPMARELQGGGASFELHYAAKSEAAMAYRVDVQGIGSQAAHVYLGDAGQRLDIGRLAAQWRSTDHVYVCGPGRMIEDVRHAAGRNALPPRQLHFESFGPQRRLDDARFIVELRRSRRVLEVGAEQSVLQAMDEAGLYAPSDCLRGECGTCAVRVADGEVDHRDTCLSFEDRDVARLMTPCVSRAAGSRLVLEL